MDFAPGASEMIDLGPDFGMLELLMPDKEPSGPMEIELSSTGPDVTEVKVETDSGLVITEQLKDQVSAR